MLPSPIHLHGGLRYGFSTFSRQKSLKTLIFTNPCALCRARGTQVSSTYHTVAYHCAAGKKTSIHSQNRMASQRRGSHFMEERKLCQHTISLDKNTSRSSQQLPSDERKSSNHGSPVPEKPTWKRIDPKELPSPPEIDLDLVNRMEQLALVDFADQRGVERMREAIALASELQLVDTAGVEPLHTVLEHRQLYMAPDEVTEGGQAEELMRLAPMESEGYYVSPVGNIPLERREQPYGADNTASKENVDSKNS